MNHIHGYPHSEKAEFYKLLLDYDDSLERDLADYGTIWYESGTHNLMVGDYGITDRLESMIISKNFGFIKRLVENNKINFSIIPNKIKEIGIPMKINGEIKYGFDSSDYYWLLMLLSISDSPIEFLISVLK